jgi:hypothetical protein
MKKSFVNQKGQVLIIVIAVIAALTVYGLSLLRLTDPELKISKRQIDSTKAFYIAEAGMERVFYYIKRDGGIINVTFDQQVDFGDGIYTISKTDIAFNKWIIKSNGEYNNSTRRIQVDVEVENVSVWNNAICGGSGMAEAIISGNAAFRGSLHILGEGLSSSDIAINLGGGAGVGNNYEGMDEILRNKVPPLAKTFFNEEWVDFLNAKLRVKHGKVKLSGTAYIGEEDVLYNAYKETLQGVYVTDRFTDDTNVDNVFSDNGIENGYDLNDVEIVFPSLNDGPYEGYATYLDYLKAKGLQVDVSVISADTSDFEHGVAGGNHIKWVQSSGTLTIEGTVWVDDTAGLTIGKARTNDLEDEQTIIFDGKGTLVSAYPGADIFIHDHLLSNGEFPTEDSLGLISAGDINVATGEWDDHLNIMGAFYAEDTITMAKQTDLVGTFVSDYIDMGSQVPKIYQVPTLADNLPPDMPGLSINYSLIITNWREVSN